jgi:hypothetical protein
MGCAFMASLGRKREICGADLTNCPLMFGYVRVCSDIGKNEAGRERQRAKRNTPSRNAGRILQGYTSVYKGIWIFFIRRHLIDRRRRRGQGFGQNDKPGATRRSGTAQSTLTWSAGVHLVYPGGYGGRIRFRLGFRRFGFGLGSV